MVCFRLDRRDKWKVVAEVATEDDGYRVMRASTRSGDWWITTADRIEPTKGKR